MARYKVGDLVEVFSNRRGNDPKSNRVQVTEVLATQGEQMYTGVRVMDHSRWVSLKKSKPDLAEALEIDFLESQVSVSSKR